MNRNVGSRNSVDSELPEGMLRVVGKAHAQRHKRVRRDSISGIKGVRFNSKGGNWEATLWRNRKGIRLGRFNTARAAAEAFKNGVSRWEYLEANRLTDSVEV